MKTLLSVLLIPVFNIILFAQPALQPTRSQSSSEIEIGLYKLKVLGSVLYIAAHPDDENTAVLAYLSRSKMVRAAYLSLTHGSGGQNLLGSEKDSLLGVLRTEELRAARSFDGTQQFFTHAADFGYSKSFQETLDIWDEEKVLSEVVRVIRTFRPDVILTRFGPEQGGHGHHTASALLAQKAFRSAGDANLYPGTKPWQPKRLLWNTWNPQPEIDRSLISIDIGDYNTFMGMSYFELAALSRSMHKSQGFGSTPVRGSDPEYFTHTLGDTGFGDLFQNIDLTWGRVQGGEKVSAMVDDIISRFDHSAPRLIIPDLLKLRTAIKKLPDHFWVDTKITEIDHLIQACAGLWLEAIAPDYIYTPYSPVPISFTIVNRSDYPFRIHSIKTSFAAVDTIFSNTLEQNIPFVYEKEIDVHSAYNRLGNRLFSAENRMHTNDLSSFYCTYTILAGNDTLYLKTPVLQRNRDRIRGERFREVVFAPPATVNFNTDVMFFPNGQPRDLHGTIKVWGANTKGRILFHLPDGWSATPAEIDFDLNEKFAGQNFSIRVAPGKSGSSGSLRFAIDSDQFSTPFSSHEIAYDHIPEQTVFLDGGIKLARSDLKILPGKIGYIMGSGDQIPECLSQIGYEVHLLSDDELDNSDLSIFDAIITGTRAYNARPRLQQQKPRLMDYVNAGGTLITLHNTRFGFSFADIGPYPFNIGRARVSVEQAPVKILTPQNPIFLYPNIISDQDFEGWVQERGLYFASDWDQKYTPLMASHDPDEPWQEGGNLYAQYGKGHYVYSAYSWFRQLPAGVPGAYRLFVNMLSLGAKR